MTEPKEECCPVCASGRKPPRIKRLGKCCCFHTPPRSFLKPEEP